MPDSDFFRPTVVPAKRPKAGHFDLLARGPVDPNPRVQKPEGWGERADAWLWERPILHAIAGSLVIFLLLGSLIYLTLKVARMKP